LTETVPTAAESSAAATAAVMAMMRALIAPKF